MTKNAALSFIQAATKARLDQYFARFAVKGHPQGGFTIAETLPGTTQAIYQGSFNTKGIALKSLENRKAEAFAQVMKGRPIAEVLGEAKPEAKDQNLNLNLNLKP